MINKSLSIEKKEAFSAYSVREAMNKFSTDYIRNFRDIPKALTKIGLNMPLPVIVIIGGASDIEPTYQKPVRNILDILLKFAEDHKAVVVDGGTSSGVMDITGRIKGEHDYRFPLVGVAVRSLVSIPGSSNLSGKISLQPNHSHFIFVRGDQWGHESVWISKIASAIARELPSLTVLLNGGEISEKDIQNSLAEKRPVITIRGTGRLADSIPEKPGRIYAVDASEMEQFVMLLFSILGFQ